MHFSRRSEGQDKRLYAVEDLLVKTINRDVSMSHLVDVHVSKTEPFVYSESNLVYTVNLGGNQSMYQWERLTKPVLTARVAVSKELRTVVPARFCSSAT